MKFEAEKNKNKEFASFGVNCQGKLGYLNLRFKLALFILNLTEDFLIQFDLF